MTSRRRHNFTAATKDRAYVRSTGICECHRLPNWNQPICGRPLGPGNAFYEHIEEDAISGRNDLDNCAVLTKTCWRLRTQQNLATIAKSNRVRRRARGIGRERGQPMLGSKDSGWKKFMDGSWERRS